MPDSDPRRTARRRYGAAAIGILCILAFYLTFSWLELNSLKANAAYGAAFNRMVQASSRLELAIHRKFHDARGQHVTSQRQDQEVEQAFGDLLMIFSALRATDEDGVAEDEEEFEESDEQEWDRFAESIDWDQEGDKLALDLTEGTMPSHLVALWEADGDEDSLESLIGELIEQAHGFLNAETGHDEGAHARLVTLERLMVEKVHPALIEVSAVLEAESAESANMIFAILIISAVAIAVVALINVMATFAPNESAAAS